MMGEGSMDVNSMTDEQREEAGRTVDFVNSAWSLRARIADDRGIRIGWNIGHDAYDAIVVWGPTMVGLGSPVTVHPSSGRATLCGFEARRDDLLPGWGIVLSLAPGDPE